MALDSKMLLVLYVPTMLFLLAMMEEYLRSQIDQRAHRIIELERDILTVRAELKVLEDALQHLDNDLGHNKTHGESKAAPHTSRKKDKRAPTHFQLSEHWEKIFKLLADSSKPFTASDIVAAAELVNKPMKTSNVRAQIAYYFKRKIFRRIDTGKYLLSDAGLEMLRNIRGADTSALELSTTPSVEAGPPQRSSAWRPEDGSVLRSSDLKEKLLSDAAIPPTILMPPQKGGN